MNHSESVFNFFLNAPELKIHPKLIINFPYPHFSLSDTKITVENSRISIADMIGKQAESCFEVFLNNSNRYKKIASNIQIQGLNETLGELDYLIHDSILKKIYHIELSCKFYVLDNSSDDELIHQWKGPNLKDSLVEKLVKLRDKQFPLLFASETLSILKDLSLDPSTIEQRLCLKAFLFIPKGIQKKELPDNFNSCVVGQWITYTDFLTEAEDAEYAVPEKKKWLVPPQSLNSWNSFSETKRIVKEQLTQRHSPLVYKRRQSHIDYFFVVWWK